MKINKIIKKNLFNKFLFLGVIPFLLISFWVIASLFFNNKISFSVLLYRQAQNDIKLVTSEKLLKGDKISGEFVAKENYLGLVMLRFNEYIKHDFKSEDVLAFRVKQKEDKNWYYINNYRSGLLENNLLFPFGFPVINNSKDRIYQFEIESLLGNETNAAEVSKNHLSLFTGYQFPKSEILSSKKATFNFLIKKSTISFTNLDFLLSSSLYLIPLIAYVFIYLMSLWWKKIKNLRVVLSRLLILLILLDIFIIKEVYIGVLSILIFGWVYSVIKNKFDSKINFLFVFLLILIWILFTVFDISEFQNKINIWAFTFLTIGLIHTVIEEKRVIKNK